MNAVLDESLYKVAVEVFERGGLLAVPPEETPSSSPPPSERARVDFKGPVNGALLVKTYGNLLPALARQMADGKNAGTDVQIDALKEISNIICGNILPYAVGPHCILRIGPPLAGDPARDPAPPEWILWGQTKVLFPEGRIELQLYGEKR